MAAAAVLAPSPLEREDEHVLLALTLTTVRSATSSKDLQRWLAAMAQQHWAGWQVGPPTFLLDPADSGAPPETAPFLEPVVLAAPHPPDAAAAAAAGAPAVPSSPKAAAQAAIGGATVCVRLPAPLDGAAPFGSSLCVLVTRGSCLSSISGPAPSLLEVRVPLADAVALGAVTLRLPAAALEAGPWLTVSLMVAPPPGREQQQQGAVCSSAAGSTGGSMRLAALLPLLVLPPAAIWEVEALHEAMIDSAGCAATAFSAHYAPFARDLAVSLEQAAALAPGAPAPQPLQALQHFLAFHSMHATRDLLAEAAASGRWRCRLETEEMGSGRDAAAEVSSGLRKRRAPAAAAVSEEATVGIIDVISGDEDTGKAGSNSPRLPQVRPWPSASAVLWGFSSARMERRYRRFKAEQLEWLDTVGLVLQLGKVLAALARWGAARAANGGSESLLLAMLHMLALLLLGLAPYLPLAAAPAGNWLATAARAYRDDLLVLSSLACGLGFSGGLLMPRVWAGYEAMHTRVGGSSLAIWLGAFALLPSLQHLSMWAHLASMPGKMLPVLLALVLLQLQPVWMVAAAVLAGQALAGAITYGLDLRMRANFMAGR